MTLMGHRTIQLERHEKLSVLNKMSHFQDQKLYRNSWSFIYTCDQKASESNPVWFFVKAQNLSGIAQGGPKVYNVIDISLQFYFYII